MKSKEWYLQRKQYLTGTDISAIMGLNPWKTPLAVYIDKTDKDHIGTEYNEAMHFGTLLEPVVVAEYSRRTGNHISFPDEMLVAKDYEFAAANIDGWINDKEGVLECKTTGNFSSLEWGVEGTDQVPKHILMQVAWYAFVANVPYVDIAVLMGGQNFKIYRYDRNYELENGIVLFARDFWKNHILAKNPPNTNTPQDILRLYPRSMPKQVKATDEVKSMLNKMKLIKAEIQSKEDTLNHLKMQVQEYMCDAGELVDINGETLATWKNSKNRLSFDKDKLRQDNNDLYNKYMIEKPGPRIFNLKK